ncbi:MAG: DNA methyltransferase [Akkermansia sp.]
MHQLLQGDCLDVITSFPDNYFHAVCTDPPFGIFEYTEKELLKLRKGSGGIWRIPPSFGGSARKPLPRFSILTNEQKLHIQNYFEIFAQALFSKLRPGAHILLASNPTLMCYIQMAFIQSGYENRATIMRVYNGFRGGDRPKGAETEFSNVCVSPRANYEPWLLFRKPITERTISANLRKWQTGGLRMCLDGSIFPDVIKSEKTPQNEKNIINHPSLKPQKFLRSLVYSLLPLGQGIILDPFAGSGSTLAACIYHKINSIGIELDDHYYQLAIKAIPQLASLYPERDLDFSCSKSK